MSDIQHSVDKLGDKIDKIAETVIRVDTNMISLIGEDGRVGKIEKDVKSHNKFIWIGLGLAASGLLGEGLAHGGQLITQLIK